MTKLSTTEAKIEQAAKDYLVRCKHYGSPSATPKDHFEAGIDYALSHILPSRCVGFAEWANWNYEISSGNDGKWLHRKENPVRFYTTAELYQKYNEYLKQHHDQHNQDH